MSENPRVGKLKVPSEEMNDILVWMIRPMKEMEQNFGSQIKEMKSLVDLQIDRFKGVKEHQNHLDEQFKDFQSVPNKLERRISALESKLKFYEDMEREQKMMGEELRKHHNLLINAKDENDKIFNELLQFKENNKWIKSQIERHDQVFYENYQNFEELKNAFKEHQMKSKEDFFEMRSFRAEALEDKRKIAEEMNKKHDALQDKCKGFMQALDQLRNQLVQSDQDLSVQFMQAIESVKEHLINDLMSRLLNLEKIQKEEKEFFDNIGVDVKLVEKRCEKLAQLVKEIKAEMGV